MKSKIALFLAAILFFNIILPSKVFASSVQDQSKPIFGLTADQVVEKYNQLTDQQKDQVLRSLGNTSIFANSLFGNIFNSTFGALNDAVVKLGDLFFQANGVVYKLGSSALAWVSRLIDKVFNNDLTDLNISQPVINDFYINTRDYSVEGSPFFSIPNNPLSGYDRSQFQYCLPLPNDDSSYIYRLGSTSTIVGFVAGYFNNNVSGLFVDLTTHTIRFGQTYPSFVEVTSNPDVFSFSGLIRDGYYVNSDFNYYLWYYYIGAAGHQWKVNQSASTTSFSLSFTGNDYLSTLQSFLENYCVSIYYYYVYDGSNIVKRYINFSGEQIPVTNNTYYNYIYNIPDLTPLNVNNIVSNTAINYDPVENLIQYLPDNYNIEQNFSVVNNYYISSGSAITGQAIDVNIVSPGVIDVRVINPEDLTQQVTNNVSKDIINNTDVNFGNLDFSPSVTVGLNAAKDSIDGIVPVTGSSIVAQFVSGIPPDWLALGFVFLILFIVAGFGMSIIRH